MGAPSQVRGSGGLKKLDRLLGIPLAYGLGLFRGGPPRSLGTPKRIGLMNLTAIGDTLLMSGPIMDLRMAWPEADIVLFTSPNNASAAGLIGGFDRLEVLDLKNPLACIRVIRAAGRFDWWIDFDAWPRLSAVLSGLVRAAVKIGFQTQGQYRHFPFDFPVRHSNRIHELENHRNLVRQTGLKAVSPPRLNHACLATGSQEAPDRKFVVLHVFPGGFKSHLREWPSERWLDVAGHLLDLGYHLVLTGGSEDRQRAEALTRRFEPGSVTALAGTMDLIHTARLLTRASLVISVNTGLMHLAALVKAPLIALHGPTSVQRWGPVGDPDRIVNLMPEGLTCAPCLNLGFEYGCDHGTCMKQISTNRVLEALDRLLAQNQPGQGPKLRKEESPE